VLPSATSVSESTLEAPTAAESAAPGRLPARDPAPRALRGLLRRYPWWITAGVLVVVSVALILWARTRPSYDAYGWLTWGYQTLHLSLDLGGAPSWKPLPYIFTVPYALFGHYELWLWMLTAVAVSLAGSVFAARIAYRLTLRGTTGADEVHGEVDANRRYAALAAALFAGIALLGLEDYMHYILSVQSDPMIVTFTLAGIDMYLSGRPRWAFVLGVVAGLGRPEAWSFLGPYTLFVWFRIPSMRRMVVAGWAVILFMWFGVPTITNDRPFVSAQLAMDSPRELHQSQITGTISRFTELQYLPMWIAALLAAAWAGWRRNRVALWLAAGVVFWVVVEIAFALHGWPGLPRYMFEAAAVAVILAGAGVGWMLTEGPRLRRGLPRWAGVPVVAVLVAALVPGARARVRAEHSDLTHERGRTHEIAFLNTAIDDLGGYKHVRACGEPTTIVEFASALAWYVHLDVGYVGYLPDLEKQRSYPIVIFTPLPGGGWDVEPWHIRRSQRAACSNLRAKYLISPQEPGGFLLRG
jgi:hypothetical protein